MIEESYERAKMNEGMSPRRSASRGQAICAAQLCRRMMMLSLREQTLLRSRAVGNRQEPQSSNAGLNDGDQEHLQGS
jgi:hypothetical protein